MPYVYRVSITYGYTNAPNVFAFGRRSYVIAESEDDAVNTVVTAYDETETGEYVVMNVYVNRLTPNAGILDTDTFE